MPNNWVSSNNLVLLNKKNEPTFQSASSGALSTLDLAFVSPHIRSRVRSCRVGEDMGSDHFPLIMELKLGNEPINENSIVHSKFKVNKADWTTFEEETRIQISCNNLESKLKAIETGIINAAEKSMPTKSGKSKTKVMNNWWTADIEKLRKNRISARKK